MREISVELVKKTVEELCVKANLYLPDGMKEKINSCIGCEKVRCQSRYWAIL
ncbi:hypothetical protein OBE_05595 [human gut metagenome]|uniref:Uncharacterized protein n=1 Tax=human gut metagenome TaxID=408170 RepID=K1THW6_9ZZZZ